jgi:hypothetical protein
MRKYIFLALVCILFGSGLIYARPIQLKIISGVGGSAGIISGPLSIIGITPTGGNFTPGIQNGVVATINVTLSNGGSFSAAGGTLSITGTNSGGFHISGNQLLQSSGATGTAAGTYSDFSVRATLASAVNSPQDQTQSWSGTAVSGTLPDPVVAVNAIRPTAQWSLVRDYDLSQPVSSYLDISLFRTGNCIATIPPLNFSSYNRVFDSVLGVNVLNMHWDSRDFDGGSGCGHNSILLSSTSHQGSGTSTFPLNWYIEAVVRMGQATPTDSTNGSEVAAFWGTSGSPNFGSGVASEFTEFDILNEFHSSFGMSGLETHRSWGVTGSCDGGLFTYCFGATPYSSVDATIWHKVGYLVTSDGSTDIQACYYADAGPGTPLHLWTCGSERPFDWHHTPSSVVFNEQRGDFLLFTGGVNGPADYYVQYIRVYSCPSWQTSQCHGAILN